MATVIAVSVGIGIGAVAGIVLAHYASKHDIELDTCIKDKVKELPSVFRDARVSLKIATDFDPLFFDEEIVKSAIRDARSNGATIQFLTEAEVPAWYQQQEGIEIKRVQTLKQHVMTIDDCHVRLERPHMPLKFGKEQGDIALIFHRFPLLGERYSQEFDKLWTTTS